MNEIARLEERPPRQIDDTIPRELERVCQKMLAKRATERYNTAGDLADDLRHFLVKVANAATPPSTRATTFESSGPPPELPSLRPDVDPRPAKVVPKGLRSFDKHDAEFFLELLPGPRDRDGLPEVIRFWKARLEATDHDSAFKVGLIYGPSGCGKSSLVKAGLLPRLAKHIVSVYVEATRDETETRILKALRKACVGLPEGVDLIESLALIRRGRILRPGQKIVLVLDQLEQWLFSKGNDRDTELVAALRQCDGERVQAVVLVRDDFWLAASRFMRALEVRLVEGENSALVDLFDPLHARKVLEAFGRAYGVLPEESRDQSLEQNIFIDQSIAGLTQDGKVICVRLALFAEMVKGKPWNPATWNAMGGTQGVGATFLGETFSSPTAPPEHRLHERAAQAVLKALLPHTGTDIKGHMRSEGELLLASGYADRPRHFADLIRMLDPELRLITPTDPEGATGVGQTAKPGGERYYQLTHDYLVHSLDGWLTRKQRETRRGRAELRLAECSALWNARSENRFLPSFSEWTNIRLLIPPHDWTAAEAAMMRRANRVQGARAGLTLVLLAGATVAGLAIRSRVQQGDKETHALGLVQQLLRADIAQVPGIVARMGEYRRWVNPLLRSARTSAPNDPRRQFVTSVALLPVDPAQRPFLESRLIVASPGEVEVIRNALEPEASVLAPRLWAVLKAVRPGDAGLLPVAGALARFDPASLQWDQQARSVADAFVRVNPVDLGRWLELLRPVRTSLAPHLAAVVRDRGRPATERALATDLLVEYAGDNPNLLADLLMDCDPVAFRVLFGAAQVHASELAQRFRDTLRQHRTMHWDDLPAHVSWTSPAALARRLDEAEGLLADRFAGCQTLPMSDFASVLKQLGASSYRPVQVRPYLDGTTLRVAAVWSRDGLRWASDEGLSADQIERRIAELRAGGLMPVDLAAYPMPDGQPTPTWRFILVSVESTTLPANVRVTAAIPELDHWKDLDRKLDLGLEPQSLHSTTGPDGIRYYSNVWYQAPAERTFEEATLLDEKAYTALMAVGRYAPSIAVTATPRHDKPGFECRYHVLWQNQPPYYYSAKLYPICTEANW
jgi:eukaryotic-like serine/threonine-protein kinase